MDAPPDKSESAQGLVPFIATLNSMLLVSSHTKLFICQNQEASSFRSRKIRNDTELRRVCMTRMRCL